MAEAHASSSSSAAVTVKCSICSTAAATVRCTAKGCLGDLCEDCAKRFDGICVVHFKCPSCDGTYAVGRFRCCAKRGCGADLCMNCYYCPDHKPTPPAPDRMQTRSTSKRS